MISSEEKDNTSATQPYVSRYIQELWAHIRSFVYFKAGEALMDGGPDFFLGIRARVDRVSVQVFRTHRDLDNLMMAFPILTKHRATLADALGGDKSAVVSLQQMKSDTRTIKFEYRRKFTFVVVIEDDLSECTHFYCGEHDHNIGKAIVEAKRTRCGQSVIQSLEECRKLHFGQS